jgi:hypothetical protein
MPMARANFREGATPEVLLPRILILGTSVNKGCTSLLVKGTMRTWRYSSLGGW